MHTVTYCYLLLSVFLRLVVGLKVQDLKIFTKCHGKDKGMEPYYNKLITAIAPCVTESAQACRFLCGFQEMGFIDEESGKINSAEVRRVYDKYFKLDNEMKEKNIQMYISCAEGKALVSRGRCEPMRVATYCMYNAYIKFCDPSKAYKNVNIKSEEDGVVGDVLGLARGLPDGGNKTRTLAA